MNESIGVSASGRSSRRKIALSVLTGAVLIGASLTAFAAPASADTRTRIICNWTGSAQQSKDQSSRGGAQTITSTLSFVDASGKTTCTGTLPNGVSAYPTGMTASFTANPACTGTFNITAGTGRLTFADGNKSSLVFTAATGDDVKGDLTGIGETTVVTGAKYFPGATVVTIGTGASGDSTSCTGDAGKAQPTQGTVTITAAAAPASS